METYPQGLWLREIARQLNMHPDTVKRALESIGDFAERRAVNEGMPMNLPNLPVYWKLKRGFNATGIITYLRTTRKLDKIRKG